MRPGSVSLPRWIKVCARLVEMWRGTRLCGWQRWTRLRYVAYWVLLTSSQRNRYWELYVYYSYSYMNSQKQARRNQDFEENAEVLFLISDIVSLPNERVPLNRRTPLSLRWLLHACSKVFFCWVCTAREKFNAKEKVAQTFLGKNLDYSTVAWF